MGAFRLMVVSLVLGWAVPISAVHAQEDEGGEEPGCATFEDCEAAIGEALRETLSEDAIEQAIGAAAEEGDPAAAGEEEEVSDEELGEAPPTIKPGNANEFVKRLLATDPVKQLVKRVEKAATDKLRQDWAKLTKGERIGLLTFTAPIVAGLLASPALGKPLQGVINGAINGALKKEAPWLSLRVDLTSPNKVFELKVDLAPILGRAGIKF